MRESFDICVIGGGVIGLSIAIHAAQKGAKVVIVEKGKLGQEASGGRAGLLTTVSEGSSEEHPYSMLSREALQYLLHWIPELHSKTQISSGLVQQDLMRLSINQEETVILQETFQIQSAANSKTTILSAEKAREIEPLLSSHIQMAVHSPGEYHLDPVQFSHALAKMARTLGVAIKEQTEAVQLIQQNQRLYGILTNHGDQIRAKTTVLAAGAWSGLLARWAKLKLPVYPLKGQIMVLKQGDVDLNVMINTSKGYILSKPNGTIVLGATNEREKFNKAITPKGLEQLLPLFDYVPELKQCEIQELWAGLRPATSDGQPIIGVVPGWEGFYLATGHTRHGVLLSGLTGQLVAQELENNKTPHLLKAFCFERFAAVGMR
ncbi:glycine oxidase [Paenibacillus sp. W4I10]|uniref:glycine oxidase ThiO n=1 Tax=Paenibacillus sp. W4I10 TaxID=3042298 RepID=UPI0027850690|nr:glycine oxidase ThiO [Paenibacillus sp. W4I10]MDQ0720152.1 glycine oxidase [Paenibacillus sp. W4I10]